MNLDSEKKFKTNMGYCNLLEDRIVLTRDVIVDNFAKAPGGKTINRFLLLFGFIALGLINVSIENLNSNNNYFALFFFLIAAYLVCIIIINLNISSTPVIARQSIQRIKFIRSFAGLSKDRFVVIFTDDNGKTKKRLIVLPGSMTLGNAESYRAYKLMIDERLMEKYPDTKK